MTSSFERPDIDGVPLERRKADRRVNPQGANSHARFIPREELHSFSAWAPNALGGALNKAAAAPASAPPAAVSKEAPPATPAEQLLQKQAEVRAAHQRGYDDGYRDGLAALEAFKQQYAAQSTAQIGAVVNAWMQQTDALEQTLADRLAQLAVTLARQVVRSEIQQRPGVVVDVAQEALNTLINTARHVVVRVHPLDLPLVQAGASELLRARDGRLMGDEQLTRGGCVVESDLGVVDARVEACWARAVAAVGQAQAEPPMVPVDAMHLLPEAES